MKGARLGGGRRDWERKAEMLRDAEIQMESDTRRGLRERQERRAEDMGT